LEIGRRIDLRYNRGRMAHPFLLRSRRSLVPFSILAAVAIAPAPARPQAPAPAVSIDPPRLVFVESPAALVRIDGEPAWRPVEKTSLERLINTRVLVLRDTQAGVVLVHVLDGWVGAPSLAGPWAVATQVPPGVNEVAKEAGRTGAADLMVGPEDPVTRKRPTLASGMPLLVVSYQPTEVIQFEGTPSWAPIRRTDLLYVQNTTADVFRDVAVQMDFVLVAGRWYTAVSLAGPWTPIPAAELPRSFTTIPEGSPKEHVKVFLPATR
jgi:hypothetical protein